MACIEIELQIVTKRIMTIMMQLCSIIPCFFVVGLGQVFRFMVVPVQSEDWSKWGVSQRESWQVCKCILATMWKTYRAAWRANVKCPCGHNQRILSRLFRRSTLQSKIRHFPHTASVLKGNEIITAKVILHSARSCGAGVCRRNTCGKQFGTLCNSISLMAQHFNHQFFNTLRVHCDHLVQFQAHHSYCMQNHCFAVEHHVESNATQYIEWH